MTDTLEDLLTRLDDQEIQLRLARDEHATRMTAKQDADNAYDEAWRAYNEAYEEVRVLRARVVRARIQQNEREV